MRALAGRFEASGQSNAFCVMAMFSSWGRWLEVSAGGYRTVRTPLPQVIGPLVDLDCRAPGRVGLIKGSTPPDPYCHISGTYARREGMGGTAFRLLPDGRFTWSSGGCRSNYDEYGTFKFQGDRIRFTTVPYPGEETHFLLTYEYMIVAWGDRTYLAVADDRNLVSFCRVALPRKSRRFASSLEAAYLRRSDVANGMRNEIKLACLDYLLVFG